MTELSMQNLIDRIQASDPDVMDGVAAELYRAADELDSETERTKGVRAGGAHLWHGSAGAAWQDHLTRCATKLGGAGYVMREIGSVLTDMARAARDGQQTVRAESARLSTVGQYSGADAYEEARADAFKIVKKATEDFHHAEQIAHKRLYQLGDMADVGPPPRAVVPPDPKRPWWQEALFGPDHGPLLIDANGDPYGYDEDGNRVPGYQADSFAYTELQEAGIGGLTKLIPKLGRLLRGASAADDAAAVATEIRGSYAWRESHIREKIAEWYGLKSPADIQPWMEDDFARIIGTATTKSSGVFAYRLGSQDAYGVLHYDQTTKQWIAVFFRASGDRAGEFASAFRVSGDRLTQMLEYSATRQVH